MTLDRDGLVRYAHAIVKLVFISTCSYM
jgi:hypothetical protein